MAYKFGWFSTGRDEAARELLTIVYDNIQTGEIPGELSFVFCNREEGESPESDAFIDLVRQYDLDLVCFSSKDFLPELLQDAKHDPLKREEWRTEFDKEVHQRLESYEHDLIVLAGYMLIVSEMLCECYNMINLHPAKPDGPKGTWQDVIWELISTAAPETGVMMHLVTKELDRGPPITHCSFPIRNGKFGPPLKDLEAKLENNELSKIQEREGESEPYFQLVRTEGVRRELPLIIQTLRAFASGRVHLDRQQVFSGEEQLMGGYDLTGEIETYLEDK